MANSNPSDSSFIVVRTASSDISSSIPILIFAQKPLLARNALGVDSIWI